MENNGTQLSNTELYKIIAAQTSSVFHNISGVVILLADLGSLITNGSVLLVFSLSERTHTIRTNFYIASICLLSLIMAIFGTPMVVISCFNEFWFFGDAGCKYCGFVESFGGLSIMLILCLISMDSYIFVVRRSLHKTFSSSFSLIAVTICICLTFGISCCPLLGWNQYTYEGVGTACAIDLIGDEYNGQSFVVTLLVVYFIIPIFIMTFAYGSIYIKVMKEYNAQLRSSIQRSGTNEESKKWGIEKELAVTITIIIGFFLLCYSPYAFLLFIKLFNNDIAIHPIVMAIPSMITKTGGVFTPVVYLARNKTFRKQVLHLFPCFRTTTNAVNPEFSIDGPSAHHTNPFAVSIISDIHEHGTFHSVD